MDCKDFIKDNIKNIKELSDDLKYCQNRELRHKGLDMILYQVGRIEEHLKYLEVKQGDQE